MCAGIPACNRPPPHPSAVQHVGGRAREEGFRGRGHVSVTPVTQTLWVFKGLPGGSRPSLRLLLITPD